MNKLAKKELKKQKKEQKQLARMKRLSRFRFFKNFLWWLTGVLTPVVLLVIVVAVGTFLIPISTYLRWAGVENPNDYVSQEIASKNVFNGITGVSEYTMEDVPAVKMLINSLTDTLSEIDVNGNPVIKVDREKLNTLKNYKIIDDISSIFNDYVSCLSVVITVESLGVDLGEIGQIPTINDFEEVKNDENLNKRLSDGTPLETPQLYYFDAKQLPTSNGGATTFSAGQGEQNPDYRRAFKNDSNFVDELSSLTAEQITSLNFYYPALDQVPMVDFMAVFGPRFKMTTVVSLLEVFSTVDEDGLFNKILGGETIDSIGSLNMTSIKLVDVLDPPSDEKPEENDPEYQAKLQAYNRNRSVYNILKDCTGKTNYEDITLDDLTRIDTDNVMLATFIEAPTSDVYCEMPSEDDPNYDTKMQAYNAYHQNRKLYDILLNASNIPFVSHETYSELKLKHLKNIDINDVKLVTVIDPPAEYKPTLGEEDYDKKLEAYNNNREIFDILKNSTGKSSYDEITLRDLSNVNTNSVVLADILDAPTSDVYCEMPSEDDPDYQAKLQAYNAYHQNRKLYNVLLDAAGIEFENCSSYRLLTVGSLNNINIDNVRLVTVIEPPTEEMPDRNRDIYDILLDATGKTSYDLIRLGDLSNLNVDNVILANIFEAPTSDVYCEMPSEDDPEYQAKLQAYNDYHQNRKLYDILLDASGIEYENSQSYRLLKVSHLHDFDINKVKLSKALDLPSEHKPTLGEENYQEKLDAYNKNRDIYNILLDAITDPSVDSYDDIAIGHLSNLDMDNVVLANIIDAPTSDTPCEKPEESDPDYAEKMQAYDAYHKNRKLYDILLDASGIEYENYSSYRKLTVKHLNDFDINNVKLVKVIDPPSEYKPTLGEENYDAKLEAYNKNRDIYNILLDCVTDSDVDSYDDIRLSHLSSVEIDNVKLSTVMSDSSNDIIQTLIDEDNARKDEEGYEPATLGNIGERINGLLVKDVYKVDCFTTDLLEAVNNPTTYYKTTETRQVERENGKIENVVYTVYSTTGTGEKYYVAKSSSVWLFMLFDAEEVDKTTFDEETGLELHTGSGIANKYVEMDVSIKELKTRINVVSGNIMNATVRQVCDSGMLDGDYPKIYGLTFSDAIRRLNDLHP